MEKAKVERKLAAILHADVAGYSRLMGEDEVGTHQALVSCLETIEKQVARHDGVVVNLAGDALLAEFSSAVNAVECAVDVQQELKALNESRLVERQLQFRIGLNLGDVIVSDGDIHGDGVNVAARLEALAQPGGICISGTILDQVRNKLGLSYEFLGEQKVKNISEPVRAYHVLSDPATPGIVIGERRARWPVSRLAIAAIATAAVVGAGGTFLWTTLLDPSLDGPPVAEQAAVPKLPVKPSIAVLPFRNIGGDAAHDYFSDGITEDIITDLSRFRGLFVIASMTAFTYKDKPVNLQSTSRELGVRYLLEGSVQKAGSRLRVNAQLIDGTTGQHVWADRMVRELEDLFAVQDEIVQTIVAKLAVKVDKAEQDRALRKSENNLEAYDYVLRGREHCARTDRSANADARKIIRQAIELDANSASAFVALGWCNLDALRYGWATNPSKALEKVRAFAQRAIVLEEDNASAHRLLGYFHLKRNEFDLAKKQFEHALELNPNDADSHDALGSILLYSGETTAAIESIEIALRFNPNLATSGLVHLGLAYFLKERFEDAIKMYDKALAKNPDLAILHVGLAATYARAGRNEDAAQAAADVRRLSPFFSVEAFGNGFRNPSDREAIQDGLRKAGLE